MCKSASSKYTRSKVRKALPRDFAYVIEELLTGRQEVSDQEAYYNEIIRSVIRTGRAAELVTAFCNLIRRLVVDHLHVVGDIFDRGPYPNLIMDTLMEHHSGDIQWGNHDISWMGAASGNRALIANVIRISMRYNNFDVLEDGYGLNLRALAVFAGEYYKNDNCVLFMPQTLDDNIYDPVDTKLVAKMHKAITIIQLKLEGQLIERHPEWGMGKRDIFRMVDFDRGTVTIDGSEYELLDKNFPTVCRKDPLSLTDAENELMSVLENSFMHSERLNSHIRFLYSKGSMYKTINGNLLFHGCIPLDENGQLQSVNIAGTDYSGKALLDKLDEIANKAYFMQPGEEKDYAADYMWYLWSGARSPLYGKDKMAFFERYFLDDKKLHKENYNAYYHFSEQNPIELRQPEITTSPTLAGKSCCAPVCCGRYPISLRRSPPPKVISPPTGFFSDSSDFTSVLFPEPFSPTMHR